MEARLVLPIVVSALLASAPGRAQTPAVTLRMAAIAPEGTSWAREVHALSRDIEKLTRGAATMKWYMGGIAGDELRVLERIKQGQLDGSAGALFCERLSPALRVMRMLGLFQSTDEFLYVIARLRPEIDRDFAAHGFVDLGIGSFGTDIFFTRTPLDSMTALHQLRLWIWNEDDVWLSLMHELGVHTVPLPLPDASVAYDRNELDGFIAVPSAALAYQWSIRARYFTDLAAAHLPGCLTIAQRSFNRLPFDQQEAIRAAVAKFVVRFNDLGRTQDEALLGGLFEKQGLKRVPVSEAFRAQFFAETRRVREKMGETLVAPALLHEVQGWLADYRAEHGRSR